MENPSIQTDHDGRTKAIYLDNLSDADLDIFNKLLPWKCFTLDQKGRRIGDIAWAGKRDMPQSIPDPRIKSFNQRFPLQGKSVLEIVCFEGIHSIGLAAYGANVIAIDSRIENVAKTIIRTWSHGFLVNSFKCDIEQEEDWNLIPNVDIAHHVGVLYHLADPVSHLHRLCSKVNTAIMLDTHICTEVQANLKYQANEGEYRYMMYKEGGRADAFSGMHDHAKWLELKTIIQVLECGGFLNVDIIQTRNERNGPRVLLYAYR